MYSSKIAVKMKRLNRNIRATQRSVSTGSKSFLDRFDVAVRQIVGKRIKAIGMHAAMHIFFEMIYKLMRVVIWQTTVNSGFVSVDF